MATFCRILLDFKGTTLAVNPRVLLLLTDFFLNGLLTFMKNNYLIHPDALLLIEASALLIHLLLLCMVPKDFGRPQKHFTSICHFCKTIQQFMKESTFDSFKGFFFLSFTFL